MEILWFFAFMCEEEGFQYMEILNSTCVECFLCSKNCVLCMKIFLYIYNLKLDDPKIWGRKNIHVDIYNYIYNIYVWPWHQGHYNLLGEAFPDHPIENFKPPRWFDTLYLVHDFFFSGKKSTMLCILSICLLPPPSQQNRSSNRTGIIVCPVHRFTSGV